MQPDVLVEYRYRAVCEVLGGSPIGKVAVRYGTSRQSLHTWRQGFQQEGLPGLANRSRRPQTSPNRVDADIEALTCELRRQHPRWGARRISQVQQHKRQYKRWQRAEPMHLWQMDIVVTGCLRRC